MARRRRAKTRRVQAPVVGGDTFLSQGSLNAAVYSICDILRRSNCKGAMQYVPELSWILFLRILDQREELEAEEAAAVEDEFTPSLKAPYRWRDWAAPGGGKRKELEHAGMGSLFKFVNEELLPYLHGLRDRRGATSRQKVVAEIMSGVERVRVDTEKNFLDVLDRVHEIRTEGVDETHIFTLSQAYEGLLLKMGEKGSDSGQFFTPREIIRAMVKVVDPRSGQTVYDPAAGTGGFLAQAYEHMKGSLKRAIGPDLDELKRKTFYGREADNATYPIALANLVLHGIDQPNIWHGNTLTGHEIYGGLFISAPKSFDVVLTNPPFGGREGVDAQTNFAYKTSATQVLFLQHVIDSLKPAGRCGMVIDEGVLFRTQEQAFVKTKQKLLDECDLYCVVSLPPGVFSAAGAGVKTNLLFFEKGGPTERVWYYDLSDLKVGKKSPFTIERMGDFFDLLPRRAESPRSWCVSRVVIERRGYDLKAVNPNAKQQQDQRTPLEIVAALRDSSERIETAIAELSRALPRSR